MRVILILLMAFMITGFGQDKSSAADNTAKGQAGQPFINQAIDNVTTNAPTDQAINVVRGTILSVNLDENKITFKDNSTGNELTVQVADPSTLGDLKPNDNVKVTFSTSQTNTAMNVVKE